MSEVSRVEQWMCGSTALRRIREKPVEDDLGSLEEIKAKARKLALEATAKDQSARFSADATLQVMVHSYDLDGTDEIEKIRASNMRADEKITAATRFAKKQAMENLRMAFMDLDEQGISIDYGALNIDLDNVDWERLVTKDEEA